MQRKLMVVVVMALVLGLALAPNAFARKPNPMPGPQVVKNFDGDVYLFASTPAAITEDWGKLSFDLWGENFKFYFKAANLAALTSYELKVGTLVLGSFTTDALGAGSLAGEVASDSFTDQDVTLTATAQPTLTSFYPISFIYIAPAP